MVLKTAARKTTAAKKAPAKKAPAKKTARSAKKAPAKKAAGEEGRGQEGRRPRRPRRRRLRPKKAPAKKAAAKKTAAKKAAGEEDRGEEGSGSQDRGQEGDRQEDCGPQVAAAARSSARQQPRRRRVHLHQLAQARRWVAVLGDDRSRHVTVVGEAAGHRDGGEIVLAVVESTQRVVDAQALAVLRDRQPGDLVEHPRQVVRRASDRAGDLDEADLAPGTVEQLARLGHQPTPRLAGRPPGIGVDAVVVLLDGGTRVGRAPAPRG